jgi:hypothetical protein
MNNNGYTKIPNAIIRSHNLTVEEKLTWMYIASMPKDYQFTVGEACAVLRINVKTWRRCVANLENAVAAVASGSKELTDTNDTTEDSDAIVTETPEVDTEQQLKG